MGIAALMLIGVSMMPLILLALAVPYAVIRLKAENPPDSQLGVKIVVHFFFSASILIIVAGLTMLVVDWMVRDFVPNEVTDNPLGRTTIASITAKGFNMTQRIGLGMILGGAVGAGVHALILFFCSEPHLRRIRRTFIGWRFAIHGVVLMFTVTVMIILFLQPHPLRPPVEVPLRVVTATHLVWATSWLLHLALLFEAARRPLSDSVSPDMETRTQAPAKEKPIFVPTVREIVIEAAPNPLAWHDADSSEAGADDAKPDRNDDPAEKHKVADHPHGTADDTAAANTTAGNQGEPPAADSGTS